MYCSRREFIKHYNDVIIGKSFVEYESYYQKSINRFWRSFDRLQRMNLPPTARIMDIGGGIMGVLLARISNSQVTVGDVNRRAAAEIEAMGLEFVTLNLFSDAECPAGQFDLIILQEVIGHIPQPAYVVFGRLFRMLAPGGVLFLTTPNGARIRNILYLITNRQVLDHYRYPEGSEALGMQYEYTLGQMIWQMEKSGMEVLFAETYNCGWTGETLAAQIAHRATTPITTVLPHLRSGIMAACRRRPG
jgi:2-polyprenyl-3-methyl-5-hydroxy-6-metoxy-1,4-benzoquinol methylase